MMMSLKYVFARIFLCNVCDIIILFANISSLNLNLEAAFDSNYYFRVDKNVRSVLKVEKWPICHIRHLLRNTIRC